MCDTVSHIICMCLCSVCSFLQVTVCVVAEVVFVLRGKESEGESRVFYYKVNCQIGRNCPVNQNQASRTCVFMCADRQSFAPASKARSWPWCSPNLATNLGTQTDPSLLVTEDEATTYDAVGKLNLLIFKVDFFACSMKCCSKVPVATLQQSFAQEAQQFIKKKKS